MGREESSPCTLHTFFALGVKIYTGGIKVKKLIYTAILLQLSISSLVLAEPVYFADPNLKAAVEAELGIADPNQTDMLGLTYLSANHLGISDLTGLEYATDVNELHLSSNLISDLSPISELTSLINLYLNDNQITDISAVENLVNLDTLFLSINLISDLSPVSGLTGLTSLYLGSNQIIDISSLSGLSNLTMLDLTDNQVDDISVVSNLTSLEHLYLANNQVAGALPDMSNLTNLQYLHLTNNFIEDIYGLTGEEPNDLINLLLRGNTLNKVSYCTYLPTIKDNNPLISIEIEDNPYTCLPHDICSNAIEVFKNVLYEGSTVGATGPEEESSCGHWDYLDVWHSYTPDSNEVVDISLCGSVLDTSLVVFDDCGGTELACSEDYCGFQSLVTLDLTAGETYLIRVAGYDAETNGTGPYDLLITDAPEPPVNNTCQDANEIVQYSPVTGSTTTAYGTDITSCTVSDMRDVWYYFTPTISGRYLIDPNGDYDTSLAVFDDCGGTELACNDDYYPNFLSRIIVNLVEGETYYIRISGYDAGGGNYSLTVTPAPDINKDGVVDIIDLSWLAQEWMQTGTSDADIAPKEADGGGDKFINLSDFAVLFEQWLADTLL